MLVPRFYSRVVGILPSGRVTGRFYSSMPKFSACLTLDESRPSHQRGSGFNTSLLMDDLRAPRVRRAFASYGRGAFATYWKDLKVHYILDPRVLATLIPLSLSPSIPTFPPYLRPVIQFLADHGITPTHMSSDASFECVGGPPSSVFYRDDPVVSNCTACVIVAGTSFDPGKSPPAVTIIITGAERIPHMNAFLGELIGGTAMWSFFFFPIADNMDCSSVTTLQDMHRDLTPE
jgi:hypothetical protein